MLTYPVGANNRQFAVGMRTNSTITNFNFDGKQRSITFTVSGAAGTKGHVNATWPIGLLNGTFAVTMDGKQIPFTVSRAPLASQST